MRFTKKQYEEAVKNLQYGINQLDNREGGGYCDICGGEHYAWECGHNPLLAMSMCGGAKEAGRELHDEIHKLENDRDEEVEYTPWPAELQDKIHHLLHWLAGECFGMGMEQKGPARIVMPEAD